jgi:hypothetical protein
MWQRYFKGWMRSAAGSLAVAGCAWAAPLSVDFDIQPRVLHLGEAAQLTVTVHGDRSPPAPPLAGLTDCDVAGPNFSSMFNFVNGTLDQSGTFTYQLVPRRAGAIKIGPFTYKVGDRMFKLPVIELQIAAPTPAPAAPAAGAAAGSAPQQVALADLVFARLDVTPTNVFVNQSFDLTLSILSRDVNLGDGFSLNNWAPAGLTLSQFGKLPAQRTMINGQVFDVRQFRCQARALTAGHQRLAPTVRGALITQGAERPRRGGPFDDPFFANFFGRNVQTQPIEIATQPLEFTVQGLPEAGRPADFGGAIGHFTLEAQVKPDDGAVGDPITLTARIAGNGNFDSIAFPMLANSEHFKTYDAKMTSKELDGSQLAGSKTFEQIIIPKTMEANRIPAIGFSFFDITKNQYVTLSAGPFDLKLHPTVAGSAVIAGGTALANAPIGRDIAYLKPAPAEWRTTSLAGAAAGRLFWPLQTLPPLAVLAAFLLARRRDTRAGNVRLVRREQAPRSARRALRAAGQALAQGQRAAFFEALADALRSYFGNRLNLPPGDVTAEGLRHQLAAANVDRPLAERVQALFELCDRERFGAAAGAFDAAAAQTAVDDTAQLLRQFEKVRL